jgi:hypothetical protein
MADLFARRASFSEVKRDIKAVQFHKQRYDNGSVDLLAKQCFQYWMQIRNHHSYKTIIDEMEGK